MADVAEIRRGCVQMMLQPSPRPRAIASSKMNCGTCVVLPLPVSPLTTTTCTKIVQGWPKLWANFRDLIGIFSQSVGPRLAIWANPVQFSFWFRKILSGV